MQEKNIVKITYEFEDNTKLVLKGEELDKYITMCYLHSDYALPANENSKVKLKGIIRGFTPCPEI